MCLNAKRPGDQEALSLHIILLGWDTSLLFYSSYKQSVQYMCCSQLANTTEVSYCFPPATREAL